MIVVRMQTDISDSIFKSRIGIFPPDIVLDIITFPDVSLPVFVYSETVLYKTAILFPLLCGGNEHYVIHNLVIGKA